MNFWIFLLKLLDTRLPSTPTPYGAFHIASCILSLGLAFLLCSTYRKDKPDTVRRVVFAISALLVVLEVLKQINFSAGFPEGGGVEWNYQWYAFPWQFCSVPMYAGVLQGIIKKGKVHDALCAFLATYAVFAGICVMLYPGDVFTPTLFICIQTMICHGTMFPVGSYLIYSGHVQTKHKTFIGAMIVFASAMVCAVILNEVIYASGILNGATFNMFFISRHFASTLPVYGPIHSAVTFPLNLVIYFLGFSAAAYVIFLLGKGFKRLVDSVKDKKQTA